MNVFLFRKYLTSSCNMLWDVWKTKIYCKRSTMRLPRFLISKLSRARQPIFTPQHDEAMKCRERFSNVEETFLRSSCERQRCTTKLQVCRKQRRSTGNVVFERCGLSLWRVIVSLPLNPIKVFRTGPSA